MDTITIPAGTSVCFDPRTGKESKIAEDLIVHDARWGVNGSPGWVFFYRDNNPTAYTLDWRNTKETGHEKEN